MKPPAKISDSDAEKRNRLFAQALAAEKSGDNTKALEYYKMSLQVDIHFFDSWLNAGAVYSREGKSDKAIFCYQRALVTREDKRAHFNIGTEYFRQERYEDARVYLEKAIALDAAFTSGLLLLGYTEGKLKNYGKSLHYVNNVLTLDPTSYPALSALAFLYHEMGNSELALSTVRKLISRRSNDISIQRLYAALQIETGNFEQALSLLSSLAPSDPKLKKFYDTLEQSLQPRKQELLEKLEKLESISEPNALDLFNSSLLSFFTGSPQEAIEKLKQLT